MPKDPSDNILSQGSKPGFIPKGPVAKLGPKSTKAMRAALGLKRDPEDTVEGTRISHPLRTGAPFAHFKPARAPEAPEPPVVEQVSKQGSENSVSPEVMLGNTHIASYQTLVNNDSLSKPAIRAWKNDKS